MHNVSWIRQKNDGAFEIAEHIFGGIIPLILIVLGTFGNGLCILLLAKHDSRTSASTNVYLIFLCITDTLSLYQWNLNYVFMEFGSGRQLSDISIFLCKSITFLSFYTLHLSAFYLCLMTIDRTFTLWSRAYRHTMNTRSRALLVSVIVLFVLLCLDGFLLSMGFIDNETKNVSCYVAKDENLMTFYSEIYPWIHLVLMYFIPFGIMIFGIVMIIIKLHRNRNNRRQLNKRQRLGLMLVGMSIVYIVLTLPNRLFFSVFFQKILYHIYTDTVLLASNALLYTRNATNFFFLLTGSLTFRRKFIKFIQRGLCCCCYFLCCSTQTPVIPVQDRDRRQKTQLFHISN